MRVRAEATPGRDARHLSRVLYTCICVCVCVCEREERKKERERSLCSVGSSLIGMAERGDAEVSVCI